jgi:uncharacterized protein with HEPN domain
MRQHVVHGYDKIDLHILDGVLNSDLPTLVRQLEGLLSQVPAGRAEESQPL